MTFAAIGVGVAGSAISAGVGAGMSASAAGQSRKDYMAGLKAAAQMYQQSRNDINKYMTPYTDSGTRNLNLLNAALNPVGVRDYSMPQQPGAVPQWADYQNRGMLQNGTQAPDQTAFQPRQPRRPGLAGMVGG